MFPEKSEITMVQVTGTVAGKGRLELTSQETGSRKSELEVAGSY